MMKTLFAYVRNFFSVNKRLDAKPNVDNEVENHTDASEPLILPAFSRPENLLGIESDARNLLAPPQEEAEEVRIPRQHRIIFDAYASSQAEDDFVYRIDTVDSHAVSRVGLSDLFSNGHRYINPCDNLNRAEREYRAAGQNVDLLSDISKTAKKYVADRNGGGLYCYLKLRDAVSEQHIQAKQSESFFTLNEYREHISVLTRYRRNVIASSIFLPDPLTFSSPSAALQLTRYHDGKIASIEPDRIDIWFDGSWVKLSEAHRGIIIKDINSGDLRRILFPCEGADPMLTACWHEAGHVVVAAICEALGDFAFVGRRGDGAFGLTHVQSTSHVQVKREMLQLVAVAGFAAVFILHQNKHLGMSDSDFLQMALKGASDDRKEFHSFLQKFDDCYSEEADEYFIGFANKYVVDVLKKEWPSVEAVARALRLAKPDSMKTSRVVPRNLITRAEAESIQLLNRKDIDKLLLPAKSYL